MHVEYLSKLEFTHNTFRYFGTWTRFEWFFLNFYIQHDIMKFSSKLYCCERYGDTYKYLR